MKRAADFTVCFVVPERKAQVLSREEEEQAGVCFAGILATNLAKAQI